MVNSLNECKRSKNWIWAYYFLFVFFLVLAGIMLSISNLVKWNVAMFYAGVFIACALVSLVVACILFREINKWVESQKTYYVDTTQIGYLVEHLGFRDECDHLERTHMRGCCPYILFIDTTTGEVSCFCDEIKIHDFKFAMADLEKFGLLHVLQPVV